MEIQEIRTQSATEREKMLVERQEKLRELRFRVARRELKNIRDIRKIKKEVARILTVAKEGALKGKK